MDTTTLLTALTSLEAQARDHLEAIQALRAAVGDGDTGGGDTGGGGDNGDGDGDNGGTGGGDLPAVVIQSVTPSDDSVVLEIAPFAGAVDYRVTAAGSPKIKYSGGYHRLEWNHVTETGVTLTVEALDRLGPFQSLDDKTDYTLPHHINGQGPTDAQPVVIARSAPFTVTNALSPLRTDPTVVFFDPFHDHSEGGMHDHFMDAALPDNWVKEGAGTPTDEFYAQANTKWDAYFHAVDRNRAFIHTHDAHMMTGCADGPSSPPAAFNRNNYAAIVMSPKVRPELTDDNVIEFSFEVDGHFSGRRWIEVSIFGADEKMIWMNQTRNVNPPHQLGADGGLFSLWMIDRDLHTLMQTLPDAQGKRNQFFGFPNGNGDWTGREAMRRMTWDDKSTGLNNPKEGEGGLLGYLDLRSKFTFRVTTTTWEIEEKSANGVTLFHNQGAWGQALPTGPKRLAISHLLYHSSLEEQELRQYLPTETYWIDRTPEIDQRHWDSVAVRVYPKAA